MKLTKTAYQKLIKNEIAWLRTNSPPCQERQHIISVLKRSVGLFYSNKKTTKQTRQKL